MQTWNGRDVHRDLEEELIDAFQYAIQSRKEREDLEKELAYFKERYVISEEANQNLRREIEKLGYKLGNLESQKNFKGEFTPAEKDYLQEIEDRIGRLEELVNRLVDRVSMVEQSQGSIFTKGFDPT